MPLIVYKCASSETLSLNFKQLVTVKKSAIFNVRSLPLPAAAKERNFISALKLYLSFEGLCFELRLEFYASASFLSSQMPFQANGLIISKLKIKYQVFIPFPIYSLISP